MKTILYLLLVMPVFCFAQAENSTAPKPSTDDCPSWNKKSKSSSKAEYFQYLRSPKSIKNQQERAVYYPNAQRIAAGTQVQTQRTTEQNLFFIPRKERHAIQAPPETTPAKEKKTVPLKKEEIITEPKPEEVTIPNEEPPVASTNANQSKKEEIIPTKETSTDPKTTIKDKPKTESTFKRWFHHTSTKKTKVCKSSGDASKCPSF